jgi:hypothetical protein
MQNPRSLSDLLSRTGNKLTTLKARLSERSVILEQVRAALPPRLAKAVVSAGIERGQLTVGVAGAVWASRLRYYTDALGKQVSASMRVEIRRVRIRVAASSPGTAK